MQTSRRLEVPLTRNFVDVVGFFPGSFSLVSWNTEISMSGGNRTVQMRWCILWDLWDSWYAPAPSQALSLKLMISPPIPYPPVWTLAKTTRSESIRSHCFERMYLISVSNAFGSKMQRWAEPLNAHQSPTSPRIWRSNVLYKSSRCIRPASGCLYSIASLSWFLILALTTKVRHQTHVWLPIPLELTKDALKTIHDTLRKARYQYTWLTYFFSLWGETVKK